MRSTPAATFFPGNGVTGRKSEAVLDLHGPQPWNVTDSGGNNFSGAGDNADRWDFFGNPDDFKSNVQSIPYCSGFVPGRGLGGVTCTSTSGV